ncbi:hypothetical protein H0H92_006813, partial [Tricholoma furcatifolium]
GPHSELLERSRHTLWSYEYKKDHLQVVNVKHIVAVVAMVPHDPFLDGTDRRFFLAEKPGLDVLGHANIGEEWDNYDDE